MGTVLATFRANTSGLTGLTAYAYTGSTTLTGGTVVETPSGSKVYASTFTGTAANASYNCRLVPSSGVDVSTGSFRTDANGNDVDAILAGIAAGTTGLTLAATQSFNNAGQTTPLPATLYYAGAAVVPIDASTLPAYVAPDNASGPALLAMTTGTGASRAFTAGALANGPTGSVSEADKADIAGRVSSALAGRGVTVVSRVLADGTIEIFTGDDYTGSQAIVVPVGGTTAAGRTVSFRLLTTLAYNRPNDATAATVTATGTTSLLNGIAVAVIPLTATQTAALAPLRSGDGTMSYRYQVLDAVANVTLADGKAIVRRRIA